MKKKNVFSMLGFGVVALGILGIAHYAANHLSTSTALTSTALTSTSLSSTAEKPSTIRAASTDFPAMKNGSPAGTQKVDSVEIMAEQLRACLEAEPNDVNGWVLLGRSYHFLERWDDAKAAFAKARELGYQEADVKIDSASPQPDSVEMNAADISRDGAASGDSEIFSDIARASSRLQ